MQVRIACGYPNCDVYLTRDLSKRIQPGGRSLASLGLSHGDLVYVRVPPPDETMDVGQEDAGPSSAGRASGPVANGKTGGTTTNNPVMMSIVV